MMVQRFQPDRHYVTLHNVRDRVSDRHTDDNVMPIADHTAQ